MRQAETCACARCVHDGVASSPLRDEGSVQRGCLPRQVAYELCGLARIHMLRPQSLRVRAVGFMRDDSRVR